jgi:DNA-directed RNA polymerase subunit RPC12/RpoP
MTESAETTTESQGPIQFPCQSCGAKVEFVPGTAHLQCPYCGATQQLDQEVQKPVVEYSFEEARRQARTMQATELMQSAVEVRCQGCGAHTVVQGQASRCAFCDMPVVVEQIAKELYAPESLLPFSIDAKKAKEIMIAWLKSRWFAPGDLVLRAQRDGMSGVYLPYWTYDSRTTTSYSGQRGTYYYVEESYRDSKGQRRTRRVRKTRWSYTGGTVHVSFDDVLVPATKSLPRPLVDSLEPWDLNALTPYAASYLSGFMAERYAVDLEEGFGFAQQKMDPVIRSSICRDIGGDTQRILSMHVQHAGVTFKHFLLPLWISSFRYGDKVYRFLVNARTGEGAGERPYSAMKIALAVIAGIMLAVLLFYLFRDQ